ncbi:hypothetical protein B0J11DRAFT_182624 [Dendryphion nanum]|uniref:Transmembrane protein n=1 Tax=Dendryphion nanum TaxID=256645 RepID=A0A9P9D559_9PLEO|nr:hypothetical protein B0J11DRAFT_182624 [Dendryphion nanum]
MRLVSLAMGRHSGTLAHRKPWAKLPLYNLQCTHTYRRKIGNTCVAKRSRWLGEASTSWFGLLILIPFSNLIVCTVLTPFDALFPLLSSLIGLAHAGSVPRENRSQNVKFRRKQNTCAPSPAPPVRHCGTADGVMGHARSPLLPVGLPLVASKQPNSTAPYPLPTQTFRSHSIVLYTLPKVILFVIVIVISCVYSHFHYCTTTMAQISKRSHPHFRKPV